MDIIKKIRIRLTERKLIRLNRKYTAAHEKFVLARGKDAIDLKAEQDYYKEEAEGCKLLLQRLWQ